MNKNIKILLLVSLFTFVNGYSADRCYTSKNFEPCIFDKISSIVVYFNEFESKFYHEVSSGSSLQTFIYPNELVSAFAKSMKGRFFNLPNIIEIICVDENGKGYSRELNKEERLYLENMIKGRIEEVRKKEIPFVRFPFIE